MMKKYFILIITVTFFTTSCGSIKEAGKVLRNEKVRSTDEFLVKKNNPLTVPPNYKDLPAPKSEIKSENKDLDIERIFDEEIKIEKSKDSQVEKMILNEIKK
jgi:hypothetical protein|tara:strand:- start:612 stop:917 length:306 start_codon:yes stop_codon:yes gene_type:complete